MKEIKETASKKNENEHNGFSTHWGCFRPLEQISQQRRLKTNERISNNYEKLRKQMKDFAKPSQHKEHKNVSNIRKAQETVTNTHMHTNNKPKRANIY